MERNELRRWRTEVRNWTVEEAAGWWGVDERTWRRYESGERAVPKPLAKRVRSSTNLRRVEK